MYFNIKNYFKNNHNCQNTLERFFELGGGFECVKFQSYKAHQHWGPDSHSIHRH